MPINHPLAPRRILLIGFLAMACSARLMAEEVVAILGSDAKPYKETLAAFEEAFGGPVQVVDLSESNARIPRSARLIVAIGGRAALEKYPANVPLVYCLSPGILLPTDRKAATVKVYMTPEWPMVLKTMQNLQTNLRTLGILSLPESHNEFDADVKDVAKRLGVELIVEQMEDAGEVPERLRRLQARINALWIPPDPRLITPQNFRLIKDFCKANRIALYVPTVELMEQGTFAAIAPSFQQVGRCAADAAKKVLSGSPEDKVFPNLAVIAVSKEAAEASGVSLSEQQLKNVDRVLP